MKKSYLTEGVIFTLVGIAFMLAAIFTESIFDGLLWGFTGAALASGLGTIIKYFYWSSPKHAQRYQEKRNQEEINLHDELNEKLRDKSGRTSNTVGFYAICISMVVFSLMGKSGILMESRIIVLYLFGLLVFQIAVRVITYNNLRKRY